MKLLYKSEKGKVMEDVSNSTIIVYRTGIRDYDGIKDTYTYRTTINYETGLYTAERCTGYHANYYDIYKDRARAIEAAIQEIS